VLLGLARRLHGGNILTLFEIMNLTKLRIATAAVLAGMAAGLVLLFQSNAKLEKENQALREQLVPLEQLRADNERLAGMKTSADKPADQKQLNELLRLRGEVTGLKRQLAESAKLREQEQRALARQQEATKDAAPEPANPERELAISKMNYGKKWMLAFIMYADQHQGQFPASFDQATTLLSNTDIDARRNPGELEIVYQGSVSAVTNPANTIVIRGRQPWQTADGGWANDYSFADGHGEIHKTPDGNFEPWEKQHMQVPAAQ